MIRLIHSFMQFPWLTKKKKKQVGWWYTLDINVGRWHVQSSMWDLLIIHFSVKINAWYKEGGVLNRTVSHTSIIFVHVYNALNCTLFFYSIHNPTPPPQCHRLTAHKYTHTQAHCVLHYLLHNLLIHNSPSTNH